MGDTPTPGVPDSRLSDTQAFDPRGAQRDPLLGQVVDNLHILGVVGHGGHGTVYRARDVRLDRTVAMKLLRYPDGSVARDVLLQEARTLAKLSDHPGIVQVHGWGELGDNCYFALEYCETSVAALLSQQPQGLSEDVVLRVLLQCADALACAHAKGVLHLDIKPANILSDNAGIQFKLCDFGLARLYTRSSSTGEGVSGSPAFMSPEQLQGLPVGPASDIFSLGVTGYQLLCGQFPFPGATNTEMSDSIRAGALTPIQTYRQVSSPVSVLLEKCLAHDPAARFASAADLAAAIRTIQSPGPESPRKRTRSILVYMAALLALVFGSILYPMLGNWGGTALPVAEAEGKQALERGDYAEAASSYEAQLQDHPQDDHLWYGLGYAHLLSGQYLKAEEAFARIQDAPLAAEGHAAVAHAQNAPAARNILETALSTGDSAYATVLLATADVADGQYTAARDHLAKLDEHRLEFDWQRAQLWQTLGQASFKAGDLARARDAFERLARISTGPASQYAADYMEITQQQLTRNAYEQLSQQIARVRSLKDATPEPTEKDLWSSQPIRLWIPPADAQHSVTAAESGLADVLPWKLSKALLVQQELPLDIVDRNFTATLLQEQELSAQLSSRQDAARLGALLGARLALFCTFNSVFGEESLAATLVDVSTSRAIPIDEIPLAGMPNVTEWVDHVAGTVVNAIRDAYPLRGVVRGTPPDLEINIGSAAGIRPGMRVEFMTGPGREFLIDGISGMIEEPVKANSGRVVLERGARLPALPNGWYAEVSRGPSGAGDA